MTTAGRSKCRTSRNSLPRTASPAAQRRTHAALFAALGDATRLALVARLSGGEPRSISELTAGSALTRQAITKHLQVLENARIVHGIRAGRENLFKFNPQPLAEIRTYLDRVSEQWDESLSRLKSLVENAP
jgi:DNA-binding transcriptional ArsR family regulator